MSTTEKIVESFGIFMEQYGNHLSCFHDLKYLLGIPSKIISIRKDTQEIIVQLCIEYCDKYKPYFEDLELLYSSYIKYINHLIILRYNL